MRLSLVQNIEENLFIYRDDLYPFLGGGNKARKMIALKSTLIAGNYNAIVTTGGIQSNHCRATALFCQKNNLDCTLVIHGEKKEFHEQMGNAKIIRDTNATLIFCTPENISEIMDSSMLEYTKNGFRPFYLYGGGHTLEGGKTYIDEIEKMVETGFVPEQIYIASGTGSTQAGVLAGVSKMRLETKVIGISVGRPKGRAENAVKEFYEKLCETYNITDTGHQIIVDDRFLCGGYQNYNSDISEIVKSSLFKYNVLLDTTYTGKAFYGMLQLLKEKPCNGNVLFWNTGGTYNYFSK